MRLAHIGYGRYENLNFEIYSLSLMKYIHQMTKISLFTYQFTINIKQQQIISHNRETRPLMETSSHFFD